MSVTNLFSQISYTSSRINDLSEKDHQIFQSDERSVKRFYQNH